MKKIIYTFAILALTLVSCSDFVDVNTTTNNPLSETVPPRLSLPGAQALTFNAQVGGTRMNQLGSILTNSWAGNVNRVTGGFTKEFTQNFDNTTYNGIWDGIYQNVNNFQDIINTKIPNQENYIAIAKILKAHYMQYIVDLYGDAPYNQSFSGRENLTPSYDDDKAIYRALVTEIEEARELIENSPNAEEAISDIMLGGDMSKWVSFANTIELRLLIRQSNLTDGETVTYRNSKLAELMALNDFITQDVTINPGFSEANDDQQNPFFNDYVADAAGTAPQNRNFIVPSSHIASFLNGEQTAPYNTVGLVDERRFRMFTNPAPNSVPRNKVVGVTQGDVTIAAGGNAPTDANLSRLGIGITGLVNGSANGGNTSLQNGSRRNGFVMLASESYFLQSEAAVRYPSIFTKDAKQLFEQGITASFAFYSPTYTGVTLPSLDAAAYIAASDSYSGIGWTATSNKIEAIITQKWLALTSIHGIEPFLDFTRTGFPLTPLALTANGTTKPKRLIYPLSEYVSNSSNVPQITVAQIFTQGAFWVSN